MQWILSTKVVVLRSIACECGRCQLVKWRFRKEAHVAAWFLIVQLRLDRVV